MELSGEAEVKKLQQLGLTVKKTKFENFYFVEKSSDRSKRDAESLEEILAREKDVLDFDLEEPLIRTKRGEERILTDRKYGRRPAMRRVSRVNGKLLFCVLFYSFFSS